MACRWFVLLLVTLTFFGTGRAAGADFAQNFGAAGAYVLLQGTAVDAAGNVFIAGGFSGSTTLQLGSVTLTIIGSGDAFVAKLDSSGAVVWAKNFGGIGALAAATGIAVDGIGNVYLSGQLRDANLTTPPLIKAGNFDAFAIKLDSSGNTIWAREFSGRGSANVMAKGVAVDTSGNVYLFGHFEGANLVTPALTKIGTRDAFVLKLDPSGNTAWAKNFGGTGTFTQGNGIAIDGSGNVYLGGFYNSGELTTPSLPHIGSEDAFAFKLDSSGNTTWAKNFGGSTAFATGTCIAVDDIGNVYLGGYFSQDNLTTPAMTKIGPQDALVLKLDSFGNTTWAKDLGGGGSIVEVNSIALDGARNVYLGGRFFGVMPPLSGIGSFDVFAFKLNSFGNTAWARNFGGSGADIRGGSIAVDGSGSVYLGGFFSYANFTTPPLTIKGLTDAFIIKQGTFPDAPAGTTATAGNAQVTVSFIAPLINGGSAINGYTVISSPAGGVDSNAGSSSLSHVITGLTNETAYTFTVIATNGTGQSLPSASSNSVTPSPVVSVHSRKTHGGAGVFDLPIVTAQPVGGQVTVEPRGIGSGHTIVFLFDSAVTSAGTASVTPVGMAAATFLGSEILVTLTNVPDNQRVSVTLTNVNGSVNPSPVSIGFLVGDTNNTRSVNSSDISGVKARSGQTTTALNFKFDVNASGFVNSSDISAVKARSGLTLP